MWSNILDRISFWALFLVVVLLPVFFLPFTKVGVETSKGLLLVVGLSVSIIFWALARFSDGKISIPRSYLLLSGGGVVLAVLLSTIFSASRPMSLFGSMFDVGSFWFILASVLLMLFSAIILGNRQNARVVLLGVIASAAFLLVFQTLHIFSPVHLSLGVLDGKLANALGSWNAFGVFAGLTALMSLFLVEFFYISKMGKWVLGVLIALSLLLIAAVNYTFVWEILGVFALIIFVYKISFFTGENKTEDGTKMPFPIFSFAIVMVALLFFTSSQFIGSYIPTRLSLSSNEIGPSLGSTLTTTKGVLKADPIFGLGPNMFGQAWALYKPAQINNSVFWNTPFNVGSGLLPTFLATTGILGILAWLVFFALFLTSGTKSLFASIKKGLNPEMVIFFIASLYLFISSFFYFTGVAIFLLSLAFTGIFIGLYAGSKPNGVISVGFLNDHRKSFFFILSFVILIIATAAIAFKYVTRFTSVFYYEKALSAQNVPDAEAAIRKAVSLYANDLYLRTFAQIYTIKLSTLAAKGTALSDADKADLQTNFDQALGSTTLATQFNPKSYVNYQTLGAVYSTVASLGVKDSYDKAVEAYNTALTLNPLNPSTKLALARVSFAVGKNTEATNYANDALTLKPDYVDALVFLAQLSKSQGNISTALNYAQKALSIIPTNKDLINYVNGLKSGASTPPPASTTKDGTDTTTNKKTQ